MSHDEIRIVVDEHGDTRFVHDDLLIGLIESGDATVRRASHVEPEDGGTWSVDLSPVNGPVESGFRLRSEALKYEYDWLLKNDIPFK